MPTISSLKSNISQQSHQKERIHLTYRPVLTVHSLYVILLYTVQLDLASLKSARYNSNEPQFKVIKAFHRQRCFFNCENIDFHSKKAFFFNHSPANLLTLMSWVYKSCLIKLGKRKLFLPQTIIFLFSVSLQPYVVDL